MRGFWAQIWRSRARATGMGALLSAIIASVLYVFSWHTFYDTRANFAERRAELIARDIQILEAATDAAPGNDEAFRRALRAYVAPRRQHIAVSRINLTSPGEPVWTVTNGVPVDTSRTVLDSAFELTTTVGGNDLSPLSLDVRVGIRPRFVTALARAWSFSILDYLDDPERWQAESLYNRSIPLYGYLLTIVVVGFGTIRALYQDQQELMRLDREAQAIGAELDQLREEHAAEIEVLGKQVDRTQAQRDEAVRQRTNLEAEIAGIEREYQTLITAAPASSGDAADAALLRHTAERRSRAEQALAGYNQQVARYENELAETRAELGAAEQLLHEVEDRREGLSAKLRDRNREIRKLQGLVRTTRKETHAMQLERLRRGQASPREAQESQDTIEEQLERWVRTGNHASVNFSRHGQVGRVEQQFDKIDPAFVNRYFTHVGNREYEPGARRSIRVKTDAPDEAGEHSGELIVVLDDDAGRTFGMRFETRKDAPDPANIGFLLAMLLRSKCRDFRHYAVRAR